MPARPAKKPAHESSRDRERTRARILSAAQDAFAKKGYAAANIREIAAEAGITGALVLRYFGSKEELFAEAVAATFDLGQVFEGVPPEKLAGGFAAPLFGKQTEADLLGMLLRAAVDPAINPLARKLARERMFKPMKALLGGKDAERRAAIVLSVVTGLWLYRFLLPLEPLAGQADAETVAEVTALLDRLITGKR